MMECLKNAEIIEVGPRDGFQSIAPWIDTEVKIKTAEMLLDAGVDYLEAASFVSSRAIAQMRDAGEVCAALRKRKDFNKVCVLVPNKKGADHAIEAGVENLTMVISASEPHNRSNVNKTPRESLEELKLICAEYPEKHIKLDVATAFGCPFQGEVSLEEIMFIMDGAISLGITDIGLCDTIGVANPFQITRILQEVNSAYAGANMRLSMHLHNTRGLAAANTMAALSCGVNRFETAIAGIGGCPFAPGASGNMATEDIVYLVNELKIQTKVNIKKILAASDYLVSSIGCCKDAKINNVTVNRVFCAKEES